MGHHKPFDPKLLDYATTDRQREVAGLLNEGMSYREAAEKAGVATSRVDSIVTALRKKAARQGYAPGHFDAGVAPGYRMGKVTIQRTPNGVERVWERQHPGAVFIEEMVREAAAEWAEAARGLIQPTPAPAYSTEDLMAVYAFGDPHFGMRATAWEAGDEFDLSECDRIVRAGIDSLAASTPATKRALLLNSGDNTHSDDSTHRTRGHGHQLDVDAGGHRRAVLVSAKAWAYAIRRLLMKHAEVEFWLLPGNHDEDTSFAISLALAMHFENEPRVTIDVSPRLYRYMSFGKNLIGAHHGHKVKPADLPLLMAVDMPVEWGSAAFRYIWIGHIHHDTVKEVQGVRVESLRTLAPKDAYHAGAGYRSLRDTRAIILHEDYGEVTRHICSAAMLGAAA